MGWRRHRVRMEVFSSALITYSSSPSCSSCQVRAYGSSTQAAFSRKPGPAMKIQERCCQSSSASWAGRRGRGDADMNGAMPHRVASRASSGHARHESATSPSAGRQPAGQCLDLGGVRRCERGGTAAALTVCEPGQARLGEPATPAAHGVRMRPRLPGGACVGASTRGVRHHLCTHPQPVLGLVAVGDLLQPHAFGGTRGCRTGGADGHGGRTIGRSGSLRPRSLPHVTAPALNWPVQEATWTGKTQLRHGPQRQLPSPGPRRSPPAAQEFLQAEPPATG